MESFENRPKDLLDNLDLDTIDTSEELGKLKDTVVPLESKLPELIIDDKLMNLSEDPDIKSATDKILWKSLEWTIVNTLFLNQWAFKWKKISVYLDEVLKINPELRFFMSENWMNQFMDKKYEELLPAEKIKILALYDTINSRIYQFSNPFKDKNWKIDITKFWKAYNHHIKSIISNLWVDFKLTQLSNLGNVKKALKKDYNLSDQEVDKFLNYLEELKNHSKNEVQEAWAWAYIFFLLAWVALGALGMSRYNNFMTPKTDTVVRTGRVELWDPRMIAKLLSTEADFKTTWSIYKEQFKINENENWLIEQAKKLWNVAQNKEIIMELNGKIAVEFDLDNSKFEYDYDTGKIYASLKNPNILITEANPKILKRNSEIFEIKAFDNAQMELLDNLKKDVLSDVESRRMIYDKAIENVTKILEALYSHSFEISGMKFEWVEVIIDWIDMSDSSKKIIIESPRN